MFPKWIGERRVATGSLWGVLWQVARGVYPSKTGAIIGWWILLTEGQSAPVAHR